MSSLQPSTGLFFSGFERIEARVPRYIVLRFSVDNVREYFPPRNQSVCVCVRSLLTRQPYLATEISRAFFFFSFLNPSVIAYGIIALEDHFSSPFCLLSLVSVSNLVPQPFNRPLSPSFSLCFSSSFSSQLIPLQSRPSFRSRFLPSHHLSAHLPLGDSLSPRRDVARQWPLLNPTQSSGSDLVRLCAALFARRLSPSRTKSRLCIPPPSFTFNFPFTSRDRPRYAICFVHFVHRTRPVCFLFPQSSIDVSLLAVAADVEEDARFRSNVTRRLIFLMEHRNLKLCFFFFFFLVKLTNYIN